MFEFAEIMTRKAAAESRKPGLRDMPCIVALPNYPEPTSRSVWLNKGFSNGVLSNALVMSVGYAIKNRSYIADDYEIHLIKEVPKPTDGRVWLTLEEFLALPRGGMLSSLCYKVLNLNGDWAGILNKDERQAIAIAHPAVKDYCFPHALILLPGIKKEDFDSLVSGEKTTIKLCDFPKVVSAPIAKLVMESPENPAVRSMVRAAIKRKLPDDVVTTEAIVHWIEHNIQDLGNFVQGSLAINRVPPFNAPAPQVAEAFRVTANISDTDFGTCTYSTSRTGSCEVTITADEIDDLIGNGETLASIINRISDSVTSEAGEIHNNGDSNMSDQDTNHDNYDSSDDSPDDVEITLSSGTREQLRRDLISYLRNADLTPAQRELYGV